MYFYYTPKIIRFFYCIADLEDFKCRGFIDKKLLPFFHVKPILRTLCSLWPRMKILFEDTMPHGTTYFEQLGDATPYRWQDIRPEDLVGVDILAVRSTTKVNRALLDQADKLQFVTTATAGINHFDLSLLAEKQIEWDSAAGCNAIAVAQYVVSTLLNAERHKGYDLSSIKVGIVGAGNVGTALSRMLDALSIAYVLCDPLLDASGDGRQFVDLATVLTCDVITLHVPFTQNVEHATDKLIGPRELAKLGEGQLLINACRGEVIDEPALIDRLNAPDAPLVVLDVFNNEPDIDMHLVESVWLATPHIAGHTIEGKVRGTQMVYEQVCARLGVEPSLTLAQFMAPTDPLMFAAKPNKNKGLSTKDLSQLLLSVYDIQDDDRHFRKSMAESSQFASLRKQYRVRREYSAFTVQVPGSLDDLSLSQLRSLGFSVCVTE